MIGHFQWVDCIETLKDKLFLRFCSELLACILMVHSRALLASLRSGPSPWSFFTHILLLTGMSIAFIIWISSSLSLFFMTLTLLWCRWYAFCCCHVASSGPLSPRRRMKMIYDQDGEFKRCAFIVSGTSWHQLWSRWFVPICVGRAGTIVLVKFNHDNDFGQPKSLFRLWNSTFSWSDSIRLGIGLLVKIHQNGSCFET